MPNAKIMVEKREIVKTLADKMRNASSGVFVDYKGITVEQDTRLRAEMRKNNVEYNVVKNTLVRLAAKEVGFDALDPILNGTTALALSMEDSILPSRMVGEFAKKNKFYKIKAGFIDGQVVDSNIIARMSELPGKDVLLSMVLGTMIAPISAYARAVQAVVDQKNGGSATPVVNE